MRNDDFLHPPQTGDVPIALGLAEVALEGRRWPMVVKLKKLLFWGFLWSGYSCMARSSSVLFMLPTLR